MNTKLRATKLVCKYCKHSPASTASAITLRKVLRLTRRETGLQYSIAELDSEWRSHEDKLREQELLRDVVCVVDRVTY